MVNGGAGELYRWQKAAARRQREAKSDPRFRAGLRSNVPVLGHRTTRYDGGGGALGDLALDRLGTVTPTEKLAAEGHLNGGWDGAAARKRVNASRGFKYDDGPHYTWLQAAHEQAPSKSPKQIWSKAEHSPPSTPCSIIDACEAPTIERCESADAEVVIVGGGPHALAALAALTENSKDGTTVCVIDPGSHFLQSWNTRFNALNIKHLRSPAFAHPVAFEPTALVDFAVRKGRTSELIEAPVSGPWLASTDICKDVMLKSLPSSALFRDFCASLEARLPHRWLSAAATSVSKDASTGKFRVAYRATADQLERTIEARAVILATGPVGRWNIPAPFEPHLASRLVLHTEELLDKGKGTLSEEITRRCPTGSARVLVIGGGISAAQAALAAYRAGHQVVLRSRRPLQTSPFDIGSEWLDIRTANHIRFEFLCLPMKMRDAAVREATPGGSVPDNYMEELRSISNASSALRLEVDEAINCSQVCLAADGGGLVVNGDTFAMVILATGVVASPSSSPLYCSAKEALNAPTVGGKPQVDGQLRWVPGEDLFVLGANATLELGPGGGNLMGAMRGARVVSKELHSLMGKHGLAAHSASSASANQFAALGDRGRFGDGSESELDYLAQELQLTPQAEAALRRGRKGAHQAGKATPFLKGALKGSLKGQPDPIAFIGGRTRRATYW